ncbi:MAG: hypothetical protein NZ893_02965, partial [Candidatus Aenigmarchaeota archaeon]|nr:hypothetical protein [Candidatus Aenigmarchaeota archaeon]
RLITNFVTPSKVGEPLENFNQAYRYSQEVANCKSNCDTYVTGDCNIIYAVDYCLEKIKIDINGNKQVAEENRGGFVANVPYCEDGLYCFHIYDCKCGTFRLDPNNCRKILCDYYIREQGLSKEKAVEIITGRDGLNFGTCDPNPQTWGLREIPVTGVYACQWTIKGGLTVDDGSCAYKQADEICPD